MFIFCCALALKGALIFGFYTMELSPEITAYFEKKFADLAAKRIVTPEKPILLKRKGNQEQLDNAQNVLLSVKSAVNAIEGNNKTEALTFLKDAEKELTKRIKHIRIADNSEYGWDTVNKYSGHNLASDSDDDKRIKKAESEAAKERKAREDRRTQRKRYFNVV